MEWTTLQHLDLRHVDRGHKALQPHAAAFHPNQGIVAVAIGNYIVGEFVFPLDSASPSLCTYYSLMQRCGWSFDFQLLILFFLAAADIRIREHRSHPLRLVSLS